VEQQLPTLSKHSSSPPGFSRVSVARSLVFYVMFCRSLFVLLSFLFWPLGYLTFFDLRRFCLPLWYLRFTAFLVTPLVSSIYGVSGYPFGILDLRRFWLPLWYLKLFLLYCMLSSEREYTYLIVVCLSQWVMNLTILYVSTRAYYYTTDVIL
jgi:hypothetical protein